MSVKRVTINGTQKVWMARISYHGVRRSRVCVSKEAARQAERELSAECRQQAEQVERTGAAPATVKHLCEYYVLDLERRGKSPDSIARAVTTAKAIEAVAPGLLAMPVTGVTARDLYDFRQARLRGGAKPSTLNRDLRSMRAMLKQARPDFRFPGAAFLPEDDTRMRWLRPEEEILVLDAMPSPFREMAKLAALTLMRQGEIIALRREHVHLEQGVIMLPRAKAGARPVILSGEAQKILRGQLAGHPERLGVLRAIRRALSPGPPRQSVPDGRQSGWAARFSLPRLETPRGHDGAQSRLLGPDRDGARRLEDRAYDAPLRRGNRSDTAGSGGGGERP